MPKLHDADVIPLGSTAYKRVCDAIRADIIDGRLAGGTRLTTQAMSRRYQMSAAPIREALSQLSGDGLVEILPNRGARVRVIDEKLLRNIYEIREALDGLLAGHFAISHTAGDIALLREAQRDIEASWARFDLSATQAANQRFHTIINQARGNQEALDIIERNLHLVAHLRRSFGYDGRLETILAEHDAIIAAFEARSPEAAREAAASHVRSAADDTISRFRKLQASRSNSDAGPSA